MSEPILIAEAITKDYGERVRTHALDGVSLSLQPGELSAIIGPSGSGKSTLLNIIGLLDRPTSGRLVLCGQETTALDDEGLTNLRAISLGFVFQFNDLLPAFSALENVMIPAWAVAGLPSKEMRTDAEGLLRDVGLGDRMNDRSTDLSGGQQQRVAIARALSRRPALVLADEPTGNLDTESATGVLELMRRFNRERGTTFLVVTHDPRIAERCDRVIELLDGRIHQDRRTGASVP